MPPCSCPDTSQRQQLYIPPTSSTPLELHSTDFPATSPTPPVLSQGSWCCVALRQGRTGQMLLFQMLPFLGVCACCGRGEIFSTNSEDSPWTRATCPSANTVSEMVLPGEIPALLPLPDNSSYFIAFLCDQLFRSLGRNCLAFIPRSHSPLSLPAAMPSSLPSPCFADPVTLIKKKIKISGTEETVLR